MRKRIGYLAFFLVCFACASSFAIQVGYFNYRSYLGRANGDTMKVNDTMVAMSNSIYVKAQNIVGTILDTPSVFFIIDNSGSMNVLNYWNDSGPYSLSDTDGYRYLLDSAVIDLLYKQYPSAKVGIAVFDSLLCFTTAQDTGIMRTCPAPNANMGAYLKLLTLNQHYTGPDGHQWTGDSLAHLFLSHGVYTTTGMVHNPNLTTFVDLVYNATRPDYYSTDTPYVYSVLGTNIGIGFEAAKNAFIGDSHQKSAQYILFQSDGGANVPANYPWGFMTPPPTPTVDSVPATFTFYYNRSQAEAAQDLTFLDTLTNRISINGYSTSNHISSITPFDLTSFSALVDTFIVRVYNPIQGVLGTPTQMVIDGVKDTMWMMGDSVFQFPGLFPLTGAVTPFTANITYNTVINGRNTDSTLAINFWADRIPGAAINPDSFNVWRWDRSLVFRYNGAVVTVIDGTTDSVELLFGFSPGTANYNYSNIQVQLSNVATTPRDSESYTLTRVGTSDTFFVKFKRVVGAVVRGDKILEHAPIDTAIAIFRNTETPKLPLDTLRIACPIRIAPGAIVLSVYSDTIHAGDTASIQGFVTSSTGDTLASMRDSIRWTETPPVDAGDAVIGAQGGATRFTATQALDASGHDRVISIVAHLVNPYNRADTVRATAQITVLPDTSGLKFSIERETDTSLFRNNILTARSDFYFRADSLSVLTIDSSEISVFTYAVVRDRFGNFIRLTDSTTAWTSLNIDTVTAVAQSLKDVSGVGIVSRSSASVREEGNGRVVVSENGVAPDTIQVVLHNARLLSIRIFNDATGVEVDTVNLNTDQTITLRVRGEYATAPTVWTDVNGLWTIKPNPDSLHFIIPLPTVEAGTWQVEPNNPGHALLTVVSDNVSVTIPVIIIEGPVDSVKLVLLTNPDSCFAGKPIKIGAYVSNLNGLVLGISNDSSTYHDFLNNSARQNLPWFTLSHQTAVDSLDKQVPETFVNGIDTMSLTLYFAPSSPDSLHQIQITLNGVLQASTVAFHLNPGPLDSLQIENAAGQQIVDTITLSHANPNVGLYARGFDQYGNRIVPDSLSGLPLLGTIWSVNGTLPPVGPDSIGADILYLVPDVLIQESGLVSATVVRSSQLNLHASVPVVVLPMLPQIITAITHDGNGNGLIDRIQIAFNHSLAVTTIDTSYITVVEPSIGGPGGPTLVFKIDSIAAISDSAYSLYIHERLDSITFTAQTCWLPTVTVTNLPNALNGSVQAADGCAPVIWQAIKHIKGPDHHTDVVQLIFSQKIKGRNGAAFNLNDRVDQTLYAWTLDSSVYVRQDSILSGITNFDSNDPDSILFFTMRNGQDLTDANYLNIQAADSNIADAFGNFPTDLNRKCRVELAGSSFSMNIFPNPSRGSFTHVAPGVINLRDEPNATTWVQNDHAGTVIQISGVKLLPAGSGTVKASIKMYDGIGNLVNFSSTNDFLANIAPTASSVTDVHIYWNLSNQKGMLIAPGLYRTVVYLQYPANDLDLTNMRFTATIGVR